MVMVFVVHKAVTPGGSPIGVPMPVAPVILYVNDGNNELTQHVGEGSAAEPVLFGFTVMVPVAFTEPHPPVNGIV